MGPGAGAGSKVTSTEIRAGDLDSLIATLRAVGVAGEDLDALSGAIKSDPQPEDSTRLGPKVSEWIGTMVKKAASGIWDVAISVAGDVLAKAVSAYYGFSTS